MPRTLEESNKYKQRVSKVYSFCVSRISDKDIIAHLEANKPVNSYVRYLIKKDMEQQQ